MRIRTCVALGALGFAHIAYAQSPQGSPICVPGTPLCASTDAQGRVQIKASGTGQVNPSGANASGQANAQAGANAQASANAQARANAQAGANGQGRANVPPHPNAPPTPPPPAIVPPPNPPNPPGNVTPPGTGTTEPPPPHYGGGGTPHYRGYTGRFGVGVAGCPIVRIGVWSGFKAGGCVAVSFRFESFSFEMETQLLYGGPTHAFDWTFPMSFLIPLANQRSLFEGPYLRFGGSPVGATFASQENGGSFVRFGLFAGGGYELVLSDVLVWRVIDVRASFDMGTRRAMDDRGNWADLGVQLGTGLVL